MRLYVLVTSWLKYSFAEVATDLKCAPNFTITKPINPSVLPVCLQKMLVKATWDGALGTCQSIKYNHLSATLVTIRTGHKEKEVKDNYASSNVPMYIGLTRSGTNPASFEWMNKDPLALPTSWGLHQPNKDEGMKCVEMKMDGLWYVTSCDDELTYVCQMPAFKGPCGENDSDAACPANQDCTKTDDAFACVCTDGYTAVATTGDESLTCEVPPYTLDVETLCLPTGIELAVNNKVFTSNNIDPKSATFQGVGCLPGVAVGQWIVYSLPLSSACGTIVNSAGNEITYSNVLTGIAGGSQSMISRSRKTEVDFSCEFSKKQEVDIGGILPYIDDQKWTSKSEGIFDIQMALYKTSAYEHLQPAEFKIKVPDNLYAQIELKQAPANFFVQLADCWATPKETSEVSAGYSFLVNFIITVDQAKVIGGYTGVNSIAQFTLESFVWNGVPPDEQEIWLHCDVIVCDDNPAKTCEKDAKKPTGRRRRSNVESQDEQIAARMKIGPIKITEF